MIRVREQILELVVYAISANSDRHYAPSAVAEASIQAGKYGVEPINSELSGFVSHVCNQLLNRANAFPGVIDFK
jgi:hypothetical protein